MLDRRSCATLVALLTMGTVSAGAQAPPRVRPALFTQPVSDLEKLVVVQSWWHVGDMISTAYDLRLGGREANPVLAPFTHHPVALSVVSGAFDVLQAYALKKLAPRHPKLARIWAGALLASEIWATTNNVRAAGELQRRRGSSSGP